MSKIMPSKSKIFMDYDEYQQMIGYLNKEISPAEKKFLIEAKIFYEKHKYDSDDSI